METMMDILTEFEFMKPEVKLISVTPDAEKHMAYCARVSNPANQFNTETSEKLIKYLIKHQHWSPLEMVSACIEIETTRDIARQILRHRSFSFQEFSQRYADIRDLDSKMVVRKARLQDPKNRQNSVMTDDVSLHMAWEVHQRNVWNEAMKSYAWAIENGIAKEQARAILPEGNTPSRLYMQGSIRSWIHSIILTTHFLDLPSMAHISFVSISYFNSRPLITAVSVQNLNIR